MNPIERPLRAVDRFQRSHRWAAFPFAVVKKFGDDQAGNLAALIAYYGFFSMFPLLLVFVTVLGFVVGGNPSLERSITHSTLGHFPVVGSQIQAHSLRGSGLALVLGIVTTLWAGLGVTQAAQNAMNEIWDVARKDRPNFLLSRARGLLTLAVLGTITVATFFLSGLGSAKGQYAGGLRALGFAGAFVLNWVLYMLAFRILTRAELSWGDVLPGAIVGAVAWTVLQDVGGYYVSHQVTGARATYGTFALVIGLLVWIYLGAQLTLLAAEINVVRTRKLWPRSLVLPPLTEPDQTTLAAQAKAQRARPEEKVHVSFDERAGSEPAGPADRSAGAGPS